jgi:hypothetical protein
MLPTKKATLKLVTSKVDVENEENEVKQVKVKSIRIGLSPNKYEQYQIHGRQLYWSKTKTDRRYPGGIHKKEESAGYSLLLQRGMIKSNAPLGFRCDPLGAPCLSNHQSYQKVPGSYQNGRSPMT